MFYRGNYSKSLYYCKSGKLYLLIPKKAQSHRKPRTCVGLLTEFAVTEVENLTQEELDLILPEYKLELL